MTSYPNRARRTLSDSHRHTHEVGSAIAADILVGSGVYTISDGCQLPRGFSKRQRKRGRGVLYEVPRPNGEMAWVFRPDDPDPEKPGLKYEATCKKLGGPGNVLYVHPSQRHLIDDTSVPVVFVEGIKKALSIITAARSAGVEVLVVGILGVWNWKSGGDPISDMFDIPVEGRGVGIVYDCDILTNPSVQDACKGLAELQIDRGASVRVAFLPNATKGADDFFAAGKTYAELLVTMRVYDPEDFERVRLTRDETLSVLLHDLERRHSEADWTAPGGDADEDLYLALRARARKHGTPHPDGIRITGSWGALGFEAKIGSSRTVGKGLLRLELRDLLYRDNDGRKEGEPGAFVLRASARAGVKHKGESAAAEGKVTTSLQESDPTTLHPRAPRLWASRPKFKPTKKMIRDHRLGTLSYLPEPREGIARFGKKRSHAFDRLDAHGPQPLEELARLLGVKRPRDLVRRKKTEKGRDGLLIWPESAGILTIDDGTVSLTSNWLDRLEEVRERGEELAADEQAKKDRKRRSLAYRDHLERKRGKAQASKPSAASVAAIKRSRESKAAGLAAIKERAAAAAKTEEMRKAEAFVRSRLQELGRIRFALLEDIARDEGLDPWSIPQAVEALGCRVEELPEFDNRRFVFPPAEQVA
jgi:Domain of unknown function (DUF3854)